MFGVSAAAQATGDALYLGQSTGNTWIFCIHAATEVVCDMVSFNKPHCTLLDIVPDQERIFIDL